MTETRRDEPAPILSHLEELRWRLVKVAAAIVIAGVFALLFANQIRVVLEAPFASVCADLPVNTSDGSERDCTFQTLGATEQFSVLMRIAFFGGIVMATPVILWQIWAFISPALERKEKRWAVPIIGACVVLFMFGVVFGYWTLPRGLDFLLNIFPDVRTDLRMLDYFTFAIRFLLAFGLSFLYPVALFGAAAAGLVTSEQLARGRRWAVLIIVIVAAMITPTGDALTLTLLAVPLYLFYELTYWLIRLILRR